MVQFTFLKKTIHESVNSKNSNLCISEVLSKGRMNCSLEDISILSGAQQAPAHLKNVEVLLPNKQQVTEKLFDWGLFGISSATHSTVTAKTESPEGLQLSTHLTYKNANTPANSIYKLKKSRTTHIFSRQHFIYLYLNWNPTISGENKKKVFYDLV